MEAEQTRAVTGKQVLLTGATNGIGLAAAEALAARGANVAIVARDRQRAEQAAARARAAATAAGVESVVDVLLADLSLQSEVRRLALEVADRYEKLDVLANNAGAIFATRQLTADGVERSWALNHLAPFLLTSLLMDKLRASAPARVITTSSDASRGAHIPFDDLDGERSYGQGSRFGRGFPRYGETKLANIVFTAELARRAQGSGVSAYCFHPGLVATGFNRNNGPLMKLGMSVVRPFSRSPRKGAETLVWLAESPSVLGQEGGYFFDLKPRQVPPGATEAGVGPRLWEVSEKQVSASAFGSG
jgi:NAD(P)-dependent dehydrogenase (short-subunit alcohol dehydrogenase family)